MTSYEVRWKYGTEGPFKDTVECANFIKQFAKDHPQLDPELKFEIWSISIKFVAADTAAAFG